MTTSEPPRNDAPSMELCGYWPSLAGTPRSGDIFLIVILVALSLGLWIFSKPVANPVAFRVTCAQAFHRGDINRPPCFIPFPATATLRMYISGRLGTSTLECDPGGKVRFVSSPCPNQICVNAGWTNSPFAVVCLPNGVMIDFPETPSAFDGVAR